MKNTSLKGIVLLISSAFFFSIMPVLIRTLGSGGLPPISQVYLRYIFAFLSALFYFFYIKRAKISIEKKDYILLLIATIFGYALTNLALTYSILLTHISNALFLFYTYAIITPILGFIFLREKVNRYNIIALLLSLVALIFLFRPNSLPTWRLGGVFAMATALGQSVYLIIRRKMQSYSAAFMMLANTFIGVVVLGIGSLLFENWFYFKGGIQEVSLNTWIVTVLFGIDNFLAWFTMTKGFEYFKATAGSLILLTELVFGIILALIFFQEIPTYLTLFGGILILISSGLVIMKGKS